jgi:hypothetical protein
VAPTLNLTPCRKDVRRDGSIPPQILKHDIVLGWVRHLHDLTFLFSPESTPYPLTRILDGPHSPSGFLTEWNLKKKNLEIARIRTPIPWISSPYPSYKNDSTFHGKEGGDNIKIIVKKVDCEDRLCRATTHKNALSPASDFRAYIALVIWIYWRRAEVLLQCCKIASKHLFTFNLLKPSGNFTYDQI